MNILIITANPNPESLTTEILHEIQGQLNPKHQVTLLDLYHEKFDPVLVYDNDHRRRDLKNDPETAKYRNLISQADQLIFIFPIWWSGMPAILKGFIDRVFASGFAYSYGKFGMVGHLKGKKAWIITTHNTPALFVPFSQDYGRVLKSQVLSMCGIKPTKLTAIPFLRGSSPEKIKKHLARIAKMASQL